MLHAAILFVGISDNERNAESAFVDCRFSAREGHAMIGGENDHRFVIEVGFLENLDESSDAPVDPGNTLVILRQLFASLRCICEKVGDDHIGGIVEHFIDALMGTVVRFVAKKVRLQFSFGSFVFASTTVRIRCGEVEEERLFLFAPNELNRLFEYALGGDPSSAEAPGFGYEFAFNMDTEKLEVAFNRRQGDTHGLNYIAEASSDLIDWETLPTRQISSETHPSLSDFDRVTFEAKDATQPKQFLRLRIEAQ